MATRTRPTTTAPAGDDGPDDGVPSFTTLTPEKAVYDGPVLFRVDGREYRMQSDRSFSASLVYLKGLGSGTAVRQAQFALLDYVAGAEATEALIRAAEIEPASWTAVVNRALEHVLGKLKEDPGN